MAPAKPSILIVDDEFGLAELLRDVMRDSGYDVSLAMNGLQALETLDEKRVDLVLTDMMMPELSGSQLLQALRSDPRTASLLVVLLTARADSTDVQEGLAQGAADYITKPFQRDVLLSHIRALLQERASGTTRPEATS